MLTTATANAKIISKVGENRTIFLSRSFRKRRNFQAARNDIIIPKNTNTIPIIDPNFAAHLGEVYVFVQLLLELLLLLQFPISRKRSANFATTKPRAITVMPVYNIPMTHSKRMIELNWRQNEKNLTCPDPR